MTGTAAFLHADAAILRVVFVCIGAEVLRVADRAVQNKLTAKHSSTPDRRDQAADAGPSRGPIMSCNCATSAESCAI